MTNEKPKPVSMSTAVGAAIVLAAVPTVILGVIFAWMPTSDELGSMVAIAAGITSAIGGAFKLVARSRPLERAAGELQNKVESVGEVFLYVAGVALTVALIIELFFGK